MFNATHTNKDLGRITSKQTGAILVTAMLLLLMMTIIGVTSTGTSVLQEKMASNTRQSGLAFQAAEVALRNGEDHFDNGFGTGPTTLTRNTFGTIFNGTDPGYYSRVATPEVALDTTPITDIHDPALWTAANSAEGQAVLSSSANPPPAPRYMIEFLGRVGDPPLDYTTPDARPYAFRITAIGWGQEVNASGQRVSRVLSSTFITEL